MGKNYSGGKSASTAVTVKEGANQKPAKKYAFIGWYTKKFGGSRITSSSQVKLTVNRTYYARWAKIKSKKASISSVKKTGKGKMTIKIKNIKEATGYQIRYSLKSSLSSAKTSTISFLEQREKSEIVITPKYMKF